MSIVSACVSQILDIRLSRWQDQLNDAQTDSDRDATIDHILYHAFQEEGLQEINFEEHEEGEEVFGHYEPMRSPGVLVLHVQNIKSVFWQTIQDLFQQRFHLETSYFQQIAQLVVEKTYIHEQFHHGTDVLRYLFSSSYNRQKEEALAVAWSFLNVTGALANGKVKYKIPEGHFKKVVNRVYRYSSPGYRDWIHFQTPVAFDTELDGYINVVRRNEFNMLNLNGVATAPILRSIIEKVKDQGIIERMQA